MKKVLIVENNPVVRKMLSSALEKEGYLVEIAGDGLSAFDKLRSYTPDLIFLDLIMPNINGEQLSHMIEGREDLKETKIIVISGVAVESQGECDIKGTHACIAKGPHLVRHVVAMAKKYTEGNFQPSQNHEVIGTDNVYPRETSRELLSANRHLQVVLNHMVEGIIELNRDNRIIFANPAAARLADTTVENLLASEFTDLFPEDEKSRVIAVLKDADNKPYRIGGDNPVVFNNRHVSMNFIPVDDRDNKTLMVIILDVSKRKIAERQLVETKEYLHSVFNTIPAGILIVDAEKGTIVDANPHALQLFEVEKEKIFNRVCSDFFSETLNGPCPIYDKSESPYGSSQILKKNTGQSIHVLKTASSCSYNGKEFIVESFFDISEQKLLEEKLHAMAITDELTGLLNRRGFMMMAKKQINIADRIAGRLFLLFADLDNLKWINDTFGHDVGDQALISVARIFSSFRSSDIIARLGGDEFAILVSDTSSLSGKKQLAERFTTLLKEENKKQELGFDLGISFGVASYDPENRCHIEELIATADKLMYQSKREKKAPIKQAYLPFS